MAKKKRPAALPSKQVIDQILIDELDIEVDQDLTPDRKIEPTDDEDLLLEYILARIEEDLEIQFPENAATKIHVVQDVYNLVTAVQAT